MCVVGLCSKARCLDSSVERDLERSSYAPVWCTEPDLPEASGERKGGDRRHFITSTKLPVPFSTHYCKSSRSCRRSLVRFLFVRWSINLLLWSHRNELRR